MSRRKKKPFWLKLCVARGGALLGLALLLLAMTPGTLCDSGTAWTMRSKYSAAKGCENGRPSSRGMRKTVKATGRVQEEHESGNPSSSQAMTRKSWHGKVEIPLSSRRTIGISLSVQSVDRIRGVEKKGVEKKEGKNHENNEEPGCDESHGSC